MNFIGSHQALAAIARCQAVATTPDKALADAGARAPSKDIPIVLVDESGETTEGLVDAFESQGYKNVFYLKGGLRALRADLEAGR